MTNEFFLTIEGTRAELTRVVSAANGFLESHAIPPRSLYTVNLALEEILTNIVRHGCAGRTGHRIDVRLELKNREVIIECADDCDEFNPLDAPPPSFDKPLLECELGGLGIYLVRETTSSMEYCREPGRNVVRVRVDVPLE